MAPGVWCLILAKCEDKVGPMYFIIERAAEAAIVNRCWSMESTVINEFRVFAT